MNDVPKNIVKEIVRIARQSREWVRVRLNTLDKYQNLDSFQSHIAADTKKIYLQFFLTCRTMQIKIRVFYLRRSVMLGTLLATWHITLCIRIVVLDCDFYCDSTISVASRFHKWEVIVDIYIVLLTT